MSKIDKEMVDFLETEEEYEEEEVLDNLELTKYVVRNINGDVKIEETFIIPAHYLNMMYKSIFPNSPNHNSAEEFIEKYDANTEGILLYNIAKLDRAIIDENVYSVYQKITTDITQKRLGIILANVLVDLYVKTFDLKNNLFEDYLKLEIGITDDEWDIIKHELTVK